MNLQKSRKWLSLEAERLQAVGLAQVSARTQALFALVAGDVDEETLRRAGTSDAAAGISPWIDIWLSAQPPADSRELH